MYSGAKIVMMEDHDRAYYAWRDAGLKNRILVHLDPHIDFGWILDEDPGKMLQASSWQQVETLLKKPTLWNFQGHSMEKCIHIGNYIYPAVKEKIVREFYWVVPDGMAQTAKARKMLCRFFLNLKEIFPERVENLRCHETGVSCLLDRIPTMACSLKNLPEFSEKVLLDIDTDFFIIPRFKKSYPHFDPEEIRPWLQPSLLVQKLRAKNIASDFITIAYSVEGGYTPFAYKHLGDELKNCLQPGGEEKKLPHDNTHTTAYTNFGPVYWSLKKWKKSLEAFRQASRLDPSNPFPLCGLGNCLARQKKWKEAGDHYAKALKIKPALEEARFGLASSLLQQKRYQEALELLEEGELFKEYRTLSYFLKGQILRKMNQGGAAVSAYEQCLRAGGAGNSIHLHLGLLYLKQKRFYKARRRFQAIARWFFYYTAGIFFYRPRNFFRYALSRYQAG